MKQSFTCKLLCASVAILFAVSTVMADSNSAMLRTNGSVTVNGSAVKDSSALFDGQTVQTGENSSAVISATGSMVNVSPGSSITYRAKGIEVNNGNIGVTTTSGMSVFVNSYTLSPSQGSVKFQTVKNGFCGSVTAQQGSIIVTKGKSRNVVQEGNSIALDDQRCDKLAALPPVGAATVGALNSMPVAWGAAAGVAAASTAIILTREPHPTSPSAP